MCEGVSREDGGAGPVGGGGNEWRPEVKDKVWGGENQRGSGQFAAPPQHSEWDESKGVGWLWGVCRWVFKGFEGKGDTDRDSSFKWERGDGWWGGGDVHQGIRGWKERRLRQRSHRRRGWRRRSPPQRWRWSRLRRRAQRRREERK